jgi:hypothetical protein
MRFTHFICLAGLLCAASSVTYGADPGDALGVIDVAQNAHVDGLNAVVGTNFYAGEEFVTWEAGTVQMRIHKCRVELGAATDATFLPDTLMDHLMVRQGSAHFSCPKGGLFLLETPAGIVRGAEGQAASGMVVINDAHNLVISASGDDLILDNDGELHLIKAGESYRVTVAEEDADASAAPAPGQGPQGQHRHRRRKLAFYLIMHAGVPAAVAYVGWHYLTESPSKP